MDRCSGQNQGGGLRRPPRPYPPLQTAPTPGGPRPPRPLPPRLRLTRRARYLGRALSGTAAALVLAAAAAGWYLHASVFAGLASSHALTGLGGGPSGDGLNILLVGLDSRRDNDGNDLPPAVLAQLHAGNSSEVGGYNANTLILLHVPADGSRAIALSIPRDDYVQLPEGLGEHKIKEAYGRAKENAEDEARANGTKDHAVLEQLGREAGRHATIDAVQQLLGVTVNHFAEINLVGFYDLANALGGVTVCLREPVDDTFSGAHFPAGVQTLDGAQSLAFVRQRHGLANGDLDRTHRQQAFLASAVHKLRRAGVFDDLSKIGALLSVARKDVVVDSGFDVMSFIHQAGAVTSGDVTFYTLPIKGYAIEDGESVNIIDPVQVRDVAHQLIAGQSIDIAGPGTDMPSAPDGSVTGTGAGAGTGSTALGASPTSGPAIPQADAETATVSASASAGGSTSPEATTSRGAAVTSTPAQKPVPRPAPAPAVTAPPGIPCVY